MYASCLFSRDPLPGREATAKIELKWPRTDCGGHIKQDKSAQYRDDMFLRHWLHAGTYHVTKQLMEKKQKTNISVSHVLKNNDR